MKSKNSGNDVQAAEVKSEYTAEELAAVSRKRFGVLPEIVTAAFKMAGKERASAEEAQQIIASFMSKEVK